MNSFLLFEKVVSPKHNLTYDNYELFFAQCKLHNYNIFIVITDLVKTKSYCIVINFMESKFDCYIDLF